MATPHNFLTHLLIYPLIALLLTACGAASAPVANQVTTTTVAQMTVTPSATSVAATTATVAATATTAPTVTSAPTDMPAQTVMSTPTGTSAPTPSTPTGTSAPTPSTPPATSMPVQPTVVPVKPTVAPVKPTPQPVAPRTSVKVPAEIKLFQFKPNVLEIKAGTTVMWTNQDNIEHSVTSGTPPTPGGAFDSGFFTQGQTFTFTFSKPGTYSYFCMRHNSMVGTVKVSAP